MYQNKKISTIFGIILVITLTILGLIWPTISSANNNNSNQNNSQECSFSTFKFKSDPEGTTFINNNNEKEATVLANYDYSNWTNVDYSDTEAEWVWSSFNANSNGETQTITKDFSLTGDEITYGKIKFSADDYYKLYINETLVGQNNSQSNFSEIIETEIKNELKIGENTITFVVENKSNLNETVESYAGVIFSIRAETKNCPQMCQTEIISDTKNSFFSLLGNSGSAVKTYDKNHSWTANVSNPDAVWIWSDELVQNPQNGETKWFTRSFFIPGKEINEATLEIAADNEYTIFINGVQVGMDLDQDPNQASNFREEGKDFYNIDSFLNKGVNTITFKVHNRSSSSISPKVNPAGLLYTLKVSSLEKDNLGCEIPKNKPVLIVEPEIITINLPEIYKGDNIYLNGVTANDLEDGDLTNEIIVSGDNVDLDQQGEYLITYKVTESDGKSATGQRTIIINSPANITPNGEVCLLQETPTTKVLDLGRERLLANGTIAQSLGLKRVFELPAGDYKVWLQSFDGYETRINNSQPKEMFAVEFFSDNQSIAKSNGTQDLADNVISAYFQGKVNDSLNIAQNINFVQAFHFAYKGEGLGSANSVETVCAAFEKINNNGPINTKPIITINPETVTIQSGDNFNEKTGAVANDNEDGDITINIEITGSVDTNTPGTYYLYYNVSDSQNLPADQKIRTVIVEENNNSNPTEIKVCYIMSDKNGSIINDSNYTDGFTIKVGGSIENPLLGQEINFSVPLNLNSDLLGNDNINDAECRSIENLGYKNYTYTESVNNSTQPSFWKTAKYNDQFNDSVNSLNDLYSYSPELFDNDATNDSNRNKNSDGSINITNTRPKRTLVVMEQINQTQENTRPVITLRGNNPLIINLGQNYVEQMADVDDLEDGDIDANLVINGSVDTDTLGAYYISYDAQDSQGLNAVTVKRTVIVQGSGQCSILAKVNITNVENTGNGNSTNYSFVGSYGNLYTNNVWLPVVLNNSKQIDTYIENFINVAGLAVERRADNSIRLGLYGGHTPTIGGFSGTENLSGAIELFNANIESVEEDNTQNPIEINDSIIKNNQIVNFDLTVEQNSDAFFLNYSSTCLQETKNPPVIEVLEKLKDINSGQSFTGLEDVSAEDLEDGNITNNITTSYPASVEEKKSAISILMSEYNLSQNQINSISNLIDSLPKETSNTLSLTNSDAVKVLLSAFGKPDLGNYASLLLQTNGTFNPGNQNQTGTFAIIFNVSDSDSMSDINARIITVKENNGGGGGQNIAPVITVDPEMIIIYVGAESPVFMTGVVANDNEDGNITNNIIVGGDSVNTNTVGEYIVTYNVSDSKGLPATEKTRVYKVVTQCSDGIDNDSDGSIDTLDPECHTDGNSNNPDSYDPNDNNEKGVLNISGGGSVNYPPLIILKGDNKVQLILGETYVEQGAIANDFEDGQNLTVTDIDSSLVDTTKVGTYDVVYNFTDSSGLKAPTVKRKVVVGQIAGETIDISNVPVYPNCSLRFTEWLRLGSRGDEVKNLQMFLNEHIDANLKVDGVFGKATDKAVRDFQTKYDAYVLKPWNLKGSTGWFYKTTRMLGNLLTGCAEEAKFLEFVGKTWQTNEEFIGFIDETNKSTSLPIPN